MCCFLNLHLIPRTVSHRPLDLTDNDTLELLHVTATRCRLQISAIPGMGGTDGYFLILAEEGASCACGIVHQNGVDAEVIEFTRTLAHSLDLEAVSLAWLWSASEPKPEQLLTFDEFEARNRESRLPDNTPYVLRSLGSTPAADSD